MPCWSWLSPRLWGVQGLPGEIVLSTGSDVRRRPLDGPPAKAEMIDGRIDRDLRRSDLRLLWLRHIRSSPQRSPERRVTSVRPFLTPSFQLRKTPERFVTRLQAADLFVLFAVSTAVRPNREGIDHIPALAEAGSRRDVSLTRERPGRRMDLYAAGD